MSKKAKIRIKTVIQTFKKKILRSRAKVWKVFSKEKPSFPINICRGSL